MADESKAKRRGRPPKPVGDAARGPLTIRLRSEIRSDIERSAIRYGRSLSEEIESRLEVSAALTQYVRHELGEDIFRIAHAMAASLSLIEDWRGASWIDDDKVHEQFAGTTTALIRNCRDQVNRAGGHSVPVGDLEGKSPAELSEMFAAMGGLAPPRKKRTAAGAVAAPDEQTRAASKANMRRLLADESGEDDDT